MESNFSFQSKRKNDNDPWADSSLCTPRRRRMKGGW